MFYIIRIFNIESFIKKPLWREYEYYEKKIPYFISDSLITGFKSKTIDGVIEKPIIQYQDIIDRRTLKKELIINIRNRILMDELYNKFTVPEDVTNLIIKYL